MHKNIIKIALLILILNGILLFCLFGFNKNNKDLSNNILLLSKQSNLISLSDNFPMSDDLGKKIVYDRDNAKVQAYVEFSVESKKKKGTKYEIFAVEEPNNTIHPNYIKMYLTDNYNNPCKGYRDNYVPTIYNLKKSSTQNNGKIIYKGYIKAGEKEKFILRMWVGDAYTSGNYSNNFKIKLYAREV